MKHIFLYLLVFLLIFIFTDSNAQGARWIYFAESFDGTWYYDSESVSHNENRKSCTVWIKVYRNPESFSGNWSYELHNIEILCELREYYTYDVHIYFPNGNSKKIKIYEKEVITPESNIETLYNILCYF